MPRIQNNAAAKAWVRSRGQEKRKLGVELDQAQRRAAIKVKAEQEMSLRRNQRRIIFEKVRSTRKIVSRLTGLTETQLRLLEEQTKNHIIRERKVTSGSVRQTAPFMYFERQIYLEAERKGFTKPRTNPNTVDLAKYLSNLDSLIEDSLFITQHAREKILHETK